MAGSSFVSRRPHVQELKGTGRKRQVIKFLLASHGNTVDKPYNYNDLSSFLTYHVQFNFTWHLHSVAYSNMSHVFEFGTPSGYGPAYIAQFSTFLHLSVQAHN